MAQNEIVLPDGTVLSEGSRIIEIQGNGFLYFDPTIGFFLVSNEGVSAPIVIRQADGTALPENAFGGAWNPVGAEFAPDGSTIDVILVDGETGATANWIQDAETGINLASINLMPGDVRDAEAIQQIDIDGDGEIGHYATFVEPYGSQSLLLDTMGRYLIRPANPNPVPIVVGDPVPILDTDIVVLFDGAPLPPNAFGGNWNLVQIEDFQAPEPGSAEEASFGAPVPLVDGYFGLLQNSATGEYNGWFVDDNGNSYASVPVSPGQLRLAEVGFGVDIDGDGEVGNVGTVLDDTGDVYLIQDSFGQFYLRQRRDGETLPDSGRSPISETDILISDAFGPLPANAYGGWNPVRAEADGAGGFNIVAQNVGQGIGAIWNVDQTGLFQSSGDVLDVAGLRDIENQFGDIDGDGQIGQYATYVETFGSDALLQDTFGRYLIRSNNPNPVPIAINEPVPILETDIVLLFNGAPLPPNAFGGNWNLVQIDSFTAPEPGSPAEAVFGAPVPLRDGSIGLLENQATGQLNAWFSDVDGNYYTSVNADPARLKTLELEFNTDVDGDGQIGHYATIVEDAGDFTLLVDTLGQYRLRARQDDEQGNTPPAQDPGTITELLPNDTVLLFQGLPLPPDAFGGPWNLIAVDTFEAPESGTPSRDYFDLLFGSIAGLQDGTIGFLQNDVTGQTSLWFSDPGGNNYGSVNIESDFLQLFETVFESDLDGDGAIGGSGTYVAVNGDVGLIRDVKGQYFFRTIDDPTLPNVGDSLDFTGSEIPLLLGDGSRVVDGAPLLGGFAPVGIAENETRDGFDVLIQNGSQLAVWQLNEFGVVIEGSAVLTSAEIRNVEQQFGDVDGDGSIGHYAETIEANGGVELLLDTFGQFLVRDIQRGGNQPAAQNNEGGRQRSEILPGDGVLKIGGVPVMPDMFGGFNPIQAEALAGGGYQVLIFNETTGQYGSWQFDDTGELTASFNRSLAEAIDDEPFYQGDVNGDGAIGPSATVVSLGATGAPVLFYDALADRYLLSADNIGNFVVGETYPVPGTAIVVRFGGDPLGNATFGNTFRPIFADGLPGAFDLVMQDPGSGQTQVWTIDDNGAFVRSSGNMGAEGIRQLETQYGSVIDIDGDGAFGNAVFDIRTPEGGGNALLFDSFGNVVIRPAGTPPSPTFLETDVQVFDSAGNPLMNSGVAGYLPVAINPGEPSTLQFPFDLLLQAGPDTFAIWQLDAFGVLQNGFSVEGEQLRFLEERFQIDLNGDETIGLLGNVLGDGTGGAYLIQDPFLNQFLIRPFDGVTEPLGDTTPFLQSDIVVQYLGSPLPPNAFGGTWNPIGARQLPDGTFQIVIKDGLSGAAQLWDLDVEGNQTGSSGTLSPNGMRDLEAAFNVDIDGDGVVADPPNTKPVAEDDAAGTDEDEPVTIDVLDNDSDADPGTVLVIDAFSDGLNGTVSTDNNGTLLDLSDDLLVYTPNAGFFGTDTFTYTISDGNGGTDTATVAVTVNLVNNAPELRDPTGGGLEPTETIVPEFNAEKLAGLLYINAIKASQPQPLQPVAFDQLVSDSAGAHALDMADNDLFSYTGSDGRSAIDRLGELEPGYVPGDGFSVLNANGAGGPNENWIAAADVWLGSGNTAIAANILEGDYNVYGFGYAANTDSQFINYYNGISLIDIDASYILGLVYDDANDNGMYDDGEGVANARVDANGTGDNDHFATTNALGWYQIQVPDDTYFVSTDGVDAPGTPVVVSGRNVQIDLVGDRITIPPLPIVGFMEVLEDGPVIDLDLSLIGDDVDIDDDGTTLAYSVLDQPSDGSTSITGTTLSYDPGADFQDLALNQQRVVTIAIQATDRHGATSDAGAIKVTVTGVNDAPTAVDDTNGQDAVIEAGVNPGNTPFAGDDTATGNALANDIDLDFGVVLSVSEVNGQASNVGRAVTGTYGSVTLNADGTWTYLLANLDPDTQGLIQGQRVTDTFAYTIRDIPGETSTASLTITIDGTNDAPELFDPASGIGLPTETIVPEFSVEKLVGLLSINSIKAEQSPAAQPLAFDAILTGAANAHALDMATNDFFSQIGSDGSSASGRIQATGGDYALKNGFAVLAARSGLPIEDWEWAVNAWLTDVEPLNRANILEPDNNVYGFGHAAGTASQFTNYYNGITAIDTNGSYILGLVYDDANNNGMFDVGEGLADVRVDADGLGDNDHFALTNALGWYQIQVPDGTYLVSNDGDGLNGNQVTIAGRNAQVDFTSGSVFVPPVPIASSIDATEDGPAESLDLAPLGDDGDSDDDGSTLIYTIVGQPTEGSASISGTILIFDPGSDFQDLIQDQQRTVTIQVQATDRHNAVSNIVDIPVVVTGVADRPIANDDAAGTGEGTPVTIDVLANDSGDNPNFALVIDGFGDGLNGTVTLDDNEFESASFDDRLIYTPNNNFTGTDTFTYTVSQFNSGTDTATVTVFVGGEEIRPVAFDDFAATDEETPFSIFVLGNDRGPDPDATLSIVNITQPQNGTVSIDDNETPLDPTDDSLFYMPFPQYFGTDTFTYTISDGTLSDTATVTVSVIEQNIPPIAFLDLAQTFQNTLVSIPVLRNDIDPDTNTIPTIAAFTDPANGTVSIDDNGTPLVPNDDQIIYLPDADFLGTDTFTYTASDGELTDTATVTVTVRDPNPTPSPQADYDPRNLTPSLNDMAWFIRFTGLDGVVRGSSDLQQIGDGWIELDAFDVDILRPDADNSGTGGTTRQGALFEDLEINFGGLYDFDDAQLKKALASGDLFASVDLVGVVDDQVTREIGATLSLSEAILTGFSDVNGTSGRDMAATLDYSEIHWETFLSGRSGSSLFSWDVDDQLRGSGNSGISDFNLAGVRGVTPSPDTGTGAGESPSVEDRTYVLRLSTGNEWYELNGFSFDLEKSTGSTGGLTSPQASSWSGLAIEWEGDNELSSILALASASGNAPVRAELEILDTNGRFLGEYRLTNTLITSYERTETHDRAVIQAEVLEQVFEKDNNTEDAFGRNFDLSETQTPSSADLDYDARRLSSSFEDMAWFVRFTDFNGVLRGSSDLETVGDGWIKLDAFDFDILRQDTGSQPGGAIREGAAFENFEINFGGLYDFDDARLKQALVSGQLLTSVDMVGVSRDGATPEVGAAISLSGAQLTGLADVNGTNGRDMAASLDYREINWEIFSPGQSGSSQFSWDIVDQLPGSGSAGINDFDPSRIGGAVSGPDTGTEAGESPSVDDRTYVLRLDDNEWYELTGFSFELDKSTGSTGGLTSPQTSSWTGLAIEWEGDNELSTILARAAASGNAPIQAELEVLDNLGRFVGEYRLTNTHVASYERTETLDRAVIQAEVLEQVFERSDNAEDAVGWNFDLGQTQAPSSANQDYDPRALIPTVEDLAWFIRFSAPDAIVRGSSDLDQVGEGWIKLDAFDLDILRPDAGSQTGGTTRQGATFEDFEINLGGLYDFDAATLKQALVSGTTLTSVEMVGVSHEGGRAEVGATVAFYDVLLTGLTEVNGMAGRDMAAGLDFSEISWETFSPGQPSSVEFSWDVDDQLPGASNANVSDFDPSRVVVTAPSPDTGTEAGESPSGEDLTFVLRLDNGNEWYELDNFSFEIEKPDGSSGLLASQQASTWTGLAMEWEGDNELSSILAQAIASGNAPVEAELEVYDSQGDFIGEVWLNNTAIASYERTETHNKAVIEAEAIVQLAEVDGAEADAFNWNFSLQEEANAFNWTFS